MSPTFVAAVAFAAQMWVGAALLAGGVDKARDLSRAASAVADYRLVPRSLLSAVATGSALLELFAGAGLLLGQPVALGIAFVLIVGFSMATASALARGLDISCHCAGSDERVTSRTLIRNGLFLMAVALAAAASPWRWTLDDGSLLSPITLPIALGAALVVAGATFLSGALDAFGTAARLGRKS